jgi:hypothetical protein
LAKVDDRELWIGFVRSTLEGLSFSPDGDDLDDDNIDDVVDGLSDFVTKLADTMMDELDKRYSTSAGGRRRRGKDVE